MFVKNVVMVIPFNPLVGCIGFKYGIYFVIKKLGVAFVDALVVVKICHGVILTPALN